MAVVLFLLLRRFFGIVFLSILGMLDNWIFLNFKRQLKTVLFDALFKLMT